MGSLKTRLPEELAGQDGGYLGAGPPAVFGPLVKPNGFSEEGLEQQQINRADGWRVLVTQHVEGDNKVSFDKVSSTTIVYRELYFLQLILLTAGL